jgi:hypothetical protein
MKRPDSECKYSPLETHLRALAATQNELTLSFEQIERAMDSPLPKSAYERLTWWDNEIHSTLSHKYAWLNAGWKVETADLSKKRVRLIRDI